MAAKTLTVLGQYTRVWKVKGQTKIYLNYMMDNFDGSPCGLLTYPLVEASSARIFRLERMYVRIDGDYPGVIIRPQPIEPNGTTGVQILEPGITENADDTILWDDMEDFDLGKLEGTHFSTKWMSLYIYGYESTDDIDVYVYGELI